MQHFDYYSLLDMKEGYINLQRELEENEGELTDEMIEKFMTLDEDLEALIFSAYNIIEEVDGTIERRTNQIKRLADKNTAAEKSKESWRKLILDLVKMRNLKNKGGNFSVKVSDVSFTVGKSASVDVTEDFKDPRFTKWEVKHRMTEEHMNRIVTFLKQHTEAEDIAVNKVVDKAALMKELKGLEEGEEIEGASIIEKEKITIK